jgi:hypothetical protein
MSAENRVSAGLLASADVSLDCSTRASLSSALATNLLQENRKSHMGASWNGILTVEEFVGRHDVPDHDVRRLPLRRHAPARLVDGQIK